MRKTMKYYKSAKGKASYKKKLKADVKRSTSKAGLKESGAEAHPQESRERGQKHCRQRLRPCNQEVH
jgi:hypothetical protein